MLACFGEGVVEAELSWNLFRMLSLLWPAAARPGSAGLLAELGAAHSHPPQAA